MENIFTFLLLGFIVFVVILTKAVPREVWAYFTKGKLVTLQDHWGDTYETIAYINAFGKLTAHVYWRTGIGHAALNDDGTVYNSYIQRWIEG